MADLDGTSNFPLPLLSPSSNYLGESEMAFKMKQAVKEVLLEGKVRTYDFGGTSSTTEVGEAIAKKLCQIG